MDVIEIDPITIAWLQILLEINNILSDYKFKFTINAKCSMEVALKLVGWNLNLIQSGFN